VSSASRPCADFRLDRNAPVEQIPAVAVTVAEGNAEQPWSRQGAIRSDDRERYRQAIISGLHTGPW